MKGFQLRIIALISTASWSVVGYAQEPGESAGPASDQICDIVVRAQRRAESAQSVPISLQSFSAETLKEKAVSSTEDLTSVIGGLIIQPTSARPAIFLRGVGNNSSNTTPSVLTFIDGVYMPFGQATDFENVERIEVLKGPQGTLFGRNATGGVIQIVTRPPSETLRGHAEIGYGNYQSVDARAYVTGGIAPGVAVDFSAHYRDRNNGFGTNVVSGAEWYTDQRVSLRGRARVDF